MSFSVKKNAITLTRGDTFKANLTLTNADGSPYEPNEGDSIRFAMKKDYDDENPIMTIIIPNDTMQLVIQPENTKPLDFGDYVYDVQLTKANGEIDTFITKARITLTEEVD